MEWFFEQGKRFLLSVWPYKAVRLGLGLLFFWAGLVKIADPKAFARVIDGFGIVPDPLLAPLALTIPVLELIAGVGLLADFRGSLKLTVSLLIVFMAALCFGIASGLQIDCGCLSLEEINARDGLKLALLRDIGLLGATGYLFYWKRAKNAKPAIPN